MTDPRTLLALGGSAVGAVGGLLAAVSGAPVPGLIAGCGALVAGVASLLTRSAGEGAPEWAHPRDEDAPGALLPLVATDEVGDDAPAQAADEGADRSPAPAPAPSDDPAGSRPAPLLTDPSTGLFSEDYFAIAIDTRLAAARRHLRPVGVVLLEVVEGLRLDDVRPTDPQRVAAAVQATLREADTACRRADGRFALLLEDTPENGAIWTVERIRRHLVDEDAALTVWAGVACYPAHAFDSGSLLRAADAALVAAREWRQDRIEVAIGD